MRIIMRMAAHSSSAGARRRPVNLTLSEDVVAQARQLTPNLSATVEELLTGYISDRAGARSDAEALARAYTAEWNAVHDAVGSYADDHVNL